MERARKGSPQALLTVLALAFAIAAIWAATALANGSSPSASNDSGSSQPADKLVQSQDDPAPSGEDCPDHGGPNGGSGGGSGDSSGSDGTSSSDF